MTGGDDDPAPRGEFAAAAVVELPSGRTFVDLGNGQAAACGTADDMRAAAGYLAEHYPDGPSGPRHGPVVGPIVAMGYELRRMIRDGAPDGWTVLMRLVAGEIADDARDPEPDHPLPEGTWPWSALPVEGRRDPSGEWRDGLAERCGVTARAISDALTQLARAGYEMRTPVTDRDGRPVRDRRGRPVFAVRGHATRFHVPPLRPRPAPDSTHQSAAKPVDNPVDNPSSDAPADADSPHPGATYEGDRSHPAVDRSHESATPSPQSPQTDLSPQHIDLAAQPEVEVGQPPSGQRPDISGNGYRSPRTAEETAAEYQRQAALLAEWERQHPEAAAAAP